MASSNIAPPVAPSDEASTTIPAPSTSTPTRSTGTMPNSSQHRPRVLTYEEVQQRIASLSPSERIPIQKRKTPGSLSKPKGCKRRRQELDLQSQSRTEHTVELTETQQKVHSWLQAVEDSDGGDNVMDTDRTFSEQSSQNVQFDMDFLAAVWQMVAETHVLPNEF